MKGEMVRETFALKIFIESFKLINDKKLIPHA